MLVIRLLIVIILSAGVGFVKKNKERDDAHSKPDNTKCKIVTSNIINITKVIIEMNKSGIWMKIGLSFIFFHNIETARLFVIDLFCVFSIQNPP